MRRLFSLTNVLSLLAFGPLDTVHKNKRSDKRFSKTQDSLERVFYEATVKLCLNNRPIVFCSDLLFLVATL